MKQRYLISQSQGKFYVGVSLLISILLLAKELIEVDSIDYLSLSLEFFSDIFIYSLVSILLGFLVQKTITWFNFYYPWESRFQNRLMLEIFFLVGLVAVFSTLQSSLVQMFEIDGTSNTGTSYGVITMLMYFIGLSMVIAFHEYHAIKEQKRQVSEIAEGLKKENFLIQYNALNTQIDPHFLFNGLNVLSMLLKKDANISQKFIEEFSSIYKIRFGIQAGSIGDTQTRTGFY